MDKIQKGRVLWSKVAKRHHSQAVADRKTMKLTMRVVSVNAAGVTTSFKRRQYDKNGREVICSCLWQRTEFVFERTW